MTLKRRPASASATPRRPVSAATTALRSARGAGPQQLGEVEETNGVVSNILTDLIELRRCFVAEVQEEGQISESVLNSRDLGSARRALETGFHLGFQGEESDEEGRESISELAQGHEVRCKVLRTVHLPAFQDGGKVLGRGVPPIALIEFCVVVAAYSKRRTPIVLTGATDCTNLIWAPENGWEQLGAVSIWSVFSRFPGATCTPQDLRKAFRHIRPPATPKGVSAESAVRSQRAQTLREQEALRKEEDALKVQGAHLDPSRENFIKTAMQTTVLHEVDFGVQKGSQAQAMKTRQLMEMYEIGSDPYAVVDPLKITIPNTPRALLHLVRKRVQDENTIELTATAARVNTEKSSRWDASTIRSEYQPLKALATLRPTPVQPRQKVILTTVATHAKLPRVVAGSGDGQIMVYHLYRAHGQRRLQLHQSQGFDASRKKGDVATALHVPSQPLESEGALAVDTFIAGFESGRVAVYQVMLPDALAGIFRDGDEAVGGELEGRSKMKESEPLLTASEPLLVEHYHCKVPIVSVFWHPVLGIISVGAEGTVLIAATNGALMVSIPCAAGRAAAVSMAALSPQMEQLAVATQRSVHLWQCLSQAKAGVLDAVKEGVLREGPSPVLLLRFLPSGRYLFCVHELRGTVAIWDTKRLQLVKCVQTLQSARASAAGYDSFSHTLYICGTLGVTEAFLREERLEATLAVSVPLEFGFHRRALVA